MSFKCEYQLVPDNSRKQYPINELNKESDVNMTIKTFNIIKLAGQLIIITDNHAIIIMKLLIELSYLVTMTPKVITCSEEETLIVDVCTSQKPSVHVLLHVIICIHNPLIH